MKRALGVMALGLATVMAANAGVPAKQSGSTQAGDKATTTKHSGKAKHKRAKKPAAQSGGTSAGKMEPATQDDTPGSAKKATSTKGKAAKGTAKDNKHPNSGEPKADPQ